MTVSRLCTVNQLKIGDRPWPRQALHRHLHLHLRTIPIKGSHMNTCTQSLSTSTPILIAVRNYIPCRVPAWAQHNTLSCLRASLLPLMISTALHSRHFAMHQDKDLGMRLSREHLMLMTACVFNEHITYVRDNADRAAS